MLGLTRVVLDHKSITRLWHMLLDHVSDKGLQFLVSKESLSIKEFLSIST